MAALGSQSIASSYEQLLHVDADGGGNSTTLVSVKDGDNGTTFALQLASDNIKVSGTSDLDGQVTINESGADKDFRIEGSGEANALFVQGSDGFVGIGTAAPSKKLHVEYEVDGDYVALIKSTHATSSFGLQIQAGDSNSEKNLTLQDKDGNNTHLFYAGGNATFTGDLIMADGKGIDFSADASPSAGMTAEILDDYETGTWDAVVSDGSTPMIMDASYDEGYYTKVGNLVTVSGYFGTTSLNGLTSESIRITGLPFNIANSPSAHSGGGAAAGFQLGITAGHAVSCYTTVNNSFFYLMVWDATTGTTNMLASEWTLDGHIAISFSYRAA